MEINLELYIALSITGLFTGIGSGLGVVLAQKFYEHILAKQAEKLNGGIRKLIAKKGVGKK